MFKSLSRRRAQHDIWLCTLQPVWGSNASDDCSVYSNQTNPIHPPIINRHTTRVKVTAQPSRFIVCVFGNFFKQIYFYKRKTTNGYLVRVLWLQLYVNGCLLGATCIGVIFSFDKCLVSLLQWPRIRCCRPHRILFSSMYRISSGAHTPNACALTQCLMLLFSSSRFFLFRAPRNH